MGDEFIHHPDYQQISSFFLGTVFITSLNYCFQWIRGFFPRITGWISRKRSPTNRDLENNNNNNNNVDEKVSIMTSLSSVRAGENLTLVFILSLCFLFASIAFFGSLLSFPKGSDATCAFLAAWGGVASQTATIIGTFALLLGLKDLGIPDVEHYASLAVLFVELVLVFTNNAIGSGALKSLKSAVKFDDSICYRKHSLPTAVTTSLISILLEVYVFARFTILLTRRATLASQRLGTLCDGRIWKILSLLLLEVMTIGPSAVHITLVADFVPLSIGALFVLWTFNTYKSVGDEKDFPVFDPKGLRSTWFSTSTESYHEEMGVFENPPVVPTIAHPFSARYQQQTLRLSEMSVAAGEGGIQTVRRSVLPTATRSVTGTASEAARNDSSGGVVAANAIEVRVTDPEPSPSVTPTSILMHPWHERRKKQRRRSSADDIDLRRGEEFSYTVQGLSFPLPPVGTTRRYSTSTLGSPQEGGEGEERRKVLLLNFASEFRKSGV